MGESLCQVCGLPQYPHHGPGTMHAFSTDGELRVNSPMPPPSPEKKAKKKKSSAPIDPVLRAVLVEKGLVTSAELQEMGERLGRDGFLIVTEPVGEPGGDSGDDRDDSSDRDSPGA